MIAEYDAMRRIPLVALPLSASLILLLAHRPAHACSPPLPVWIEVAPGTAVGHPVLFSIGCDQLGYCPPQDDLDVVVSDASGADIPGTIDATIVEDYRLLAVWRPDAPLSADKTYTLWVPGLPDFAAPAEFRPAETAPTSPFENLRWELGSIRLDVGQSACCTGSPGGLCELPCVALEQEVRGVVRVEIQAPHPAYAYALDVSGRPGALDLATYRSVTIEGAPEQFCATLRATRIADGEVVSTTACLPANPAVTYGAVAPTFDDDYLDVYACPRPPTDVTCDADASAEECPALSPGVAAAWCEQNVHCAGSTDEACAHFDDYCTSDGDVKDEEDDGLYGCSAGGGVAAGLALLLGMLAWPLRRRA